MTVSPSSSPPETFAVAAPAAISGRPSPVEIDVSCRWPLLFFFLSGLGWLLVSLLFLTVSSVKLHAPGFLADSAWLTYGRIRPAGMNAFLYGFASQVGIGVLLWMMCRLGAMPMMFQVPISVASMVWNFGLAVGLLSILGGASTGFEWLEMPGFAAAILFTAYAIIGVCAVTNFCLRRERSLYVSQWFLLAALFWFPWLYSAGSLLLIWFPVRGTLQSAVNAWFTNNFLGLWLTPIGLAAIYYFIPKLVERPLHSRALAIFGFWTLAFFTNWTGLTPLIGGPVPHWMSSTATAASGGMILPLICAALNWYGTLGPPPRRHKDLTLRFMLAAALAYLAAGVAGTLLATKPGAGFVGLTFVPLARTYLALFGFVAMALFGCLYYILPRLLRIPWPSDAPFRAHFFATAVGTGMIVAALAIAGFYQGGKLNYSEAPFEDVIKSIVPFLGIATLGFVVLMVGQVIYLTGLYSLLRRWAEESEWPLLQWCCPPDRKGSAR